MIFRLGRQSTINIKSPKGGDIVTSAVWPIGIGAFLILLGFILGTFRESGDIHTKESAEAVEARFKKWTKVRRIILILGLIVLVIGLLMQFKLI